MNSVNLSDAELLAALRRMWERHDPAPLDLDERVLAAVAADELDDELVILELVSEASAFDKVRGDSERTLTFVSGEYEVLLRIVHEADGFRIDGWSAPAAAGVVHIEVEGRERAVMADELGRFAFAGIRPGRASVSMGVATGSRPVWATSHFTL